jgi:AcrR family transcriptional regulator
LWSYFPSKEELFAAVVDDTAAGIRGGMDVSAKGATPYETLLRLSRSMIERVTAPIVLQMYRLVSPLADRNPELSRMFYERGPATTQRLIADFLRIHYAEYLWTDDYAEAGKDLMALATAFFHFQGMWGVASSPTAKEKDEKARAATIMFIRAYAKDPAALLAGMDVPFP